MDGRMQLKHTLTAYQTRWSNYRVKQKQCQQVLHNARVHRLALDEHLTEIEVWANDHRTKFKDVMRNLTLRDPNRKCLYQLKAFFNEINVKHGLLHTLNEKSPDHLRLKRVQQMLNEFHDDTRVQHVDCPVLLTAHSISSRPTSACSKNSSVCRYRSTT
jgi:hypothetical protein